MELQKKGVAKDDRAYINAYRSFEGEVFESFIYEKLLRYAQDHEAITKFVVKGPHKRRARAGSDALSVNWKGQIVYRNRSKEIGEFDGLIFTDQELYFVEMTLVKSVADLRKRLRKKKALLEILFPHYEVRALVVLNEGVVGASNLPDYCTVWITKHFSADKIFEWLSGSRKRKRKPFLKVSHDKIVDAKEVHIASFPYYATLTWIYRGLRDAKGAPINMEFLENPAVQRYHDVFTKIYIGTMDIGDFYGMYPKVAMESAATQAVVAIEKEHTGELILTYFVSHGLKKLDNIRVEGKTPKVVKKDPFGITVTEIAHITRVMDASFRLRPSDIALIQELLADKNKKTQVSVPRAQEGGRYQCSLCLQSSKNQSLAKQSQKSQKESAKD